MTCAADDCVVEFAPYKRKAYCSAKCRNRMSRVRNAVYRTEWKQGNRDRLNTYARRWGSKNRETLHRYNRQALLRRRGLTEETFQALLASQGHTCAICGTDSPGQKTWRIDHDHATGKTRGLLCGPCNGALGYIEKQGWLDAASGYLKEHS